MAKKKDTNELATFVMDIATRETPPQEESTKNAAAVGLGYSGLVLRGKGKSKQTNP